MGVDEVTFMMLLGTVARSGQVPNGFCIYKCLPLQHGEHLRAGLMCSFCISA